MERSERVVRGSGQKERAERAVSKSGQRKNCCIRERGRLHERARCVLCGRLLGEYRICRYEIAAYGKLTGAAARE